MRNKGESFSKAIEKWWLKLSGLITSIGFEFEVLPTRFYCGHCGHEMRREPSRWRIECPCGAFIKFEDLVLEVHRNGGKITGQFSDPIHVSRCSNSRKEIDLRVIDDRIDD